jgi:hypothetical protein
VCGDQVVHWRRAGRFKEETIAALADLVFGDRRLEHLDGRPLDELAVSLEFAVRGRVEQRGLAGTVNRLSRRDARIEAAKAYGSG